MSKDNTSTQSDEHISFFNQHRILTEKARVLLDKCKEHEAKKLKKGYEWVTLDNKTQVLRKKK